MGTGLTLKEYAGTPVVTRMDDFHYTVEFSNVPAMVEFRSLGGLNVNEENYTWYHGSYINQITPSVANEAYSFIFNITTNYDTQSDIAVSFNYNNTEYVVTENNVTGRSWYNVTITTPNVSTDINYNWTVNITQKDNNLSSFKVNGNQTIVFFGFDSCTVGTHCCT